MMRTLKIRIINFLLTTILFVPMIILADGSGPVFAPYDAYVSDATGASLYTREYEDDKIVFKKTDKIIDYKTEVKIIDEYDVSKGVSYGSIIYDGNMKDEYDSEYYEEYYINLDKISLFKDEYTVDDLKKELKYMEDIGLGEGEVDKYKFEKSTMIVFSNEVPMYSGPSTKYAKKDTVLKKDDIVDFYNSLTTWKYIDNGKNSGWVNAEDMIYLEKNRSLWLLEDTDTYDMLGEDNFKKKDFKIPKGEKFDNVFHILYYEYTYDGTDDQVYSYFYRVVYNDEVYYISSNDKIAEAGLEYYDDNTIVIAMDTDAYDEISGKKKTTIPANTKLKSEYYYVEQYDSKGKELDEWNTWLYVKYNDNYYWIKDTNVANRADEKIITIKKSNYYDKIDGNVVSSIPANTDFEESYLFKRWYYVMINNGYYWINLDNLGRDWCDDCNDECEQYDSEMLLYDSVDGEETGKTIPANTNICPTFFYYKWDGGPISWHYINTKKYNGWIDVKNNSYSDNESEYAEINQSDNSNESTPRSSNETNEPDVVVVDNKLSKKENIIIGVITTVLASIFVLGMILLVNKNSKVKKEAEQANVEVKDEKSN